MTDTEKYQTIVVTPDQTVEMPHQISSLSSSAGCNHLVAFSTKKAALSLVTETGEIRQATLSQPVGSICMSIDPEGHFLAYTNAEEHLILFDLRDSQEQVIELDSEVANACFDGQGRLWIIRKGDEKFILELRGADDRQLIGEASFSDDYFLDGGADLCCGSSENEMFISTFSGQSEQENYHCNALNDGLTVTHLSAMDGNKIIFPSSYDASAVALDQDECKIAYYAPPYSDSSIVGDWPDYDENECEDERPGYYGCFLDSKHFLACSSEGRLFLFEVPTLKVLKEIRVKGHEPVPLSEKYPSLNDAAGFSSRLITFGKVGNAIVTVFADDWRSDHPVLVTLKIDDLLSSSIQEEANELDSDLESEIYRLMAGEIDIEVFEQWVYKNTELEKMLTSDEYLTLISLPFNTPSSLYEAGKVLKRYIDIGKYYEWKLRRVLNKVIERPADAHVYIEQCYDMYCSGYYFLDNLGLVYGLAITVPRVNSNAECWDDLTPAEQRDLIDGFYPDVKDEAEKILELIDSGIIAITGFDDELQRVEYQDTRTPKEEETAIQQKPKKKWWQLW